MASLSATAAVHTPTAKEKKYDRQLRLWAASGQQALEESHILLVIPDNPEGGSCSSVAGAETLKNLVLPSIGQFTIADPAIVCEADLGVNFFLESSSLGKSRAEEASRLLQELNPDVKGHAITSSLSDFVLNCEQLRQYSLIILCAPVAPKDRQRVSEIALELSIPLIQLHSAGFYGVFSIQTPRLFPIIDTHPDPDSVQDLRLLSSWPELDAEVTALGDIDALTDHDHGHIPYLLLLLHHLSVWRKTHNDSPPTDYAEKTTFRAQIRAAARTSNPEGGEENFDEAAGAVLKSISPHSIPSSVSALFNLPEAQVSNLTSKSDKFFFFIAALHRFVTIHNSQLPLPGTMPDMKATSSAYISLQNIYKTKSRADAAEVRQYVREIEREVGRSTPVPDAEIDTLCKSAAKLKVLHGRVLPEVRLSSTDPNPDPILQKIHKLTNGHPENDIFTSIFVGLENQSAKLSMADQQQEEDPECVAKKVQNEIERCKGVELHHTASLLGGMVAQEAIKVLTRQYVPVQGVCVWDGIGAVVGVLDL